MAAPATLREQLAWSYANLARAHAAVNEGAATYKRHHHMIRAKLYKGLRTGSMALGAAFDDEKWKLKQTPCCAFCGADGPLQADHLVPRAEGGGDDGTNLTLACRSCNASKGSRDMLVWLRGKEIFPSLILLRRYLKAAWRHCEADGIMDLPYPSSADAGEPFRLDLLPTTVFPPPAALDFGQCVPFAAPAPDN